MPHPDQSRLLLIATLALAVCAAPGCGSESDAGPAGPEGSGGQDGGSVAEAGVDGDLEDTGADGTWQQDATTGQQIDTDGDGISDEDEIAAGTDPTKADTDGDGADDLSELVAGTSPTDPEDSPAKNGDFVFVVPYQKPPKPPQSTLVFEPMIKKADVFFVIDTSHSMDNLINGVRNNLKNSIIPGVNAIIEDVQFGVGEFDRGPTLGPNGSSCAGIASNQSSTKDIPAVQAALDTLTANCGTDEPYPEALWLWATGDTSHWPALPVAGCQAGEVGYGCARPDAIPIVMLIGDEHFCEGYRLETAFVPTVQDIIDAYTEIGGRVLAMGTTVKKRTPNNSCGGLPWAGYEQIAEGTGAVNANGDPLVYEDATGANVADQVVTAISELATGGAFRLSAKLRDPEPNDGVDVTKFVDRIVPNGVGGIADPRDPTRVCVPWSDIADMDQDGVDDHFMNVPGGTPVCFDIFPAQNEIVEPGEEMQVFEGIVDVMGDDISVLDSRVVYFVVPPGLEPPPVQ